MIGFTRFHLTGGWMAWVGPVVIHYAPFARPRLYVGWDR